MFKATILSVISCCFGIMIQTNNADTMMLKLNSENGTKINENYSELDKTMIQVLEKAIISIENLMKTDQHKNSSKISSVFEKTFYKLNNSDNYPPSRKILILGLFELTTKKGIRTDGLSELMAAQMAVKHINQKKILPYTLEIVWNDTKCDPGVAVDRFFHALYTQKSERILILLGSACSSVTASLAKIVPYWNIVQISFGSTSPALSDKYEFPLFYRTVAPDSSHNKARIAFIKRFKWDTVTTFSQSEEKHSLEINDLVTELEKSNISCAGTITFAETDLKDQLSLLKAMDTRIIIGSFSRALASKIFCEVYRLGMFGADYIWILQENLDAQWWFPNNIPPGCLLKELIAAVESVLIFKSFNKIVGNEVSLSGLTNLMFEADLNSINIQEKISKYSRQSYDAVWTIALALKSAEASWRAEDSNLRVNHFDYSRDDMAKEFIKQLSQISFLGVSGLVSFNGPDRIVTSAIHQIQKGVLKHLALYYPEKEILDFHCFQCSEVIWQSGQVPIARRNLRYKIVIINPVAFYLVTVLASAGILLALSFLGFNLYFRKLKAIKLSSPKLSNMTAVGCIFVYLAVILLGIDHSTMPSSDSTFQKICTGRVYLLSAGFSLTFGSMFAKTYRIHRIFTQSWGGICKDRMLKDTQLISLVGTLLLLDGLVVSFWVITDPMKRHLHNLSLEINSVDRSVIYQPQVEVCRSVFTITWLGVLYIYKGLLLVVGLYMAYETRHVNIPALNDCIGISVYIAVVCSVTVIVFENLLSDQVTLSFVTINSLILASTTATLCLLFLPKMKNIWNKDNTPNDVVINSMGLKFECNTRRFAIDDRKELQYRVEVQNRAFKKDIESLEAEIRKLKN